MNEENGVTGAATYASDHSKDFGNHIAAMESDTGCDHPRGLLFSGSPGLSKYLAPIAQVLEPLGAGTIEATYDLPSEDIAPLVEAGVPGLTPAQDLRYYFNYHHSSGDTLDKVNEHYLAENAAVIAVTAYALADALTPPPTDRAETLRFQQGATDRVETLTARVGAPSQEAINEFRKAGMQGVRPH
jgi:hypothetical protein